MSQRGLACVSAVTPRPLTVGGCGKNTRPAFPQVRNGDNQEPVVAGRELVAE